MKSRSIAFATLLATSALTLVGCSNSMPAPNATAHHEMGAHPADDAITITDAWVKSAPSGMSAAFGTLTNTTSEDLTVVAVSSPASSTLEMHETIDDGTGQMLMRQIKGGFTVAAGTAVLLEPGGNHIMLMNLTAPLVAGEEVTFTLELADASTIEFTAVVKDFAGANETYEHGDDHGDH